jgi:hypothetical protein
MNITGSGALMVPLLFFSKKESSRTWMAGAAALIQTSMDPKGPIPSRR